MNSREFLTFHSVIYLFCMAMWNLDQSCVFIALYRYKISGPVVALRHTTDLDSDQMYHPYLGILPGT